MLYLPLFLHEMIIAPILSGHNDLCYSVIKITFISTFALLNLIFRLTSVFMAYLYIYIYIEF